VRGSTNGINPRLFFRLRDSTLIAVHLRRIRLVSTANDFGAAGEGPRGTSCHLRMLVYILRFALAHRCSGGMESRQCFKRFDSMPIVKSSLYRAFLACDTESQLRALLSDLMSEPEIIRIKQRWEIGRGRKSQIPAANGSPSSARRLPGIGRSRLRSACESAFRVIALRTGGSIVICPDNKLVDQVNALVMLLFFNCRSSKWHSIEGEKLDCHPCSRYH